MDKREAERVLREIEKKHPDEWEILDTVIRNDTVEQLLRRSNFMAVEKLGYNDHGPVHAKIVTAAAYKIWKILEESGISFDLENSLLATLLGAYLHDIGNAIHRENHALFGALMARDILRGLVDEETLAGVMHIIYSHDEEVPGLLIEAGIVSTADGCDMEEGRARIPYRKGDRDIHALSALAIRKVRILRGHQRPVRIEVRMSDYAGVFQVERVLWRKIVSNGFEKFVEIEVEVIGRERFSWPPEG